MDVLPDPEAYTMTSLDSLQDEDFSPAYLETREIPEPFKAAVC